MAGPVIIGISLTIGNIVSLLVVARDFQGRTNSVTGIYTAALNVGTMLTSAFTAPLAIVVGWRLAIAFWIIFAIIAVLLQGIVHFRFKEKKQLKSTTNKQAVEIMKHCPAWKRSIVWLLLAAFAVHLFIYYAITAWLPAYLGDSCGMTASAAGFVASLFQILALVGGFGVPVLGSMGRVSNSTLILEVAVCWVITPLGILFFPGMWLLWALICGIATGGGFTIIFMIIVNQALDLEDNRRISSFVQGLRYIISSLGPLIFGGLHQHYGNWSLGFLLLAVLAVIIVAVGLLLRYLRLEQRNFSSI